MIHAVYLVIIGVLMVSNYLLMNRIENMIKEDKKYYSKLRRRHDIEMQELREDIYTQEMIIESLKCGAKHT